MYDDHSEVDALLAQLSEEERGLVRDCEAYCAGSLDVSYEEILGRYGALTPESWSRMQAVTMARIRMHERNIEILERLTEGQDQ